MTLSSTVAAEARAVLSKKLVPKVPLWDHQLKGVERAGPVVGFGLFFEAGTGKTATSLNILREKYIAKGKLISTLILCPPIVIENWRREIAMHTNVAAPRVICLTGSQSKRRGDFRAAPKPCIVITNYESLLMQDLYTQLKAWAPPCVVYDEAHKLKDPQAKRTKQALKLARSAGVCRLALTGTPVLNSPMDLFTQIQVIDPEVFGTNFYVFRSKYFYNANASRPGHFRPIPDWRPREGALEEIADRVAAVSMAVKKEECLTLPPLVRQTIDCPLTGEQARLYKELKKDFVTYLKDQACVAQLAVTKALRLQQIVSGYIAVEGPDGPVEVQLKKNSRAEALEELLKELTPNHKVLVWAVFRHNYETIREVCRGLDVGFVEVHGDVSQKDKQEAIDRLESDPTVRVLIGHPGSGGIGCNMTAASYSIYYSRNFSLEFDLQSEARNWRGGSERHAKITRIDLVAPDTIDELVLKALASKQEVSHKLLHEKFSEGTS